MARDLETIVELQRALSELAKAQERLRGVPEWMRELHEEHSERKTNIDDLEAEAAGDERDRRVAEAAVEDAQQKLNHYQQQISQVSTQREYGALLKEIDGVKAQISGFEEQALGALERHEEAQKRLSEQRESFQDLDGRYRAELAKWEQEKPSVASRIEKLEGQIEVLKERLARPLLMQFERLLDRHNGEAIAPIAKVDRGTNGPDVWHCGICNYRVRPQVVVEVRNDGSLIQCDSCHRYLYLAEEMA